MNGEHVTQPGFEGNMDERIRETEINYLDVWLRRAEHLYVALPPEEHRSFAEYCDQQNNGIIEKTARDLNEAGFPYTPASLYDEWNEHYSEGGTRAVAKFITDIQEKLHEEGTTSESGALVSWNVVRGPLPQMANVEQGRFDPNGKYIALHLDSFFAHKDTNIRESLRTELARLAQVIATEHPDTQAIVGESWMLDRTGANIGFSVVADFVPNQDSRAARAQLLAMSGEIKEDAARKYIETGELPYKVKFGYISTEKFLQRYLPKV